MIKEVIAAETNGVPFGAICEAVKQRHPSLCDDGVGDPGHPNFPYWRHVVASAVANLKTAGQVHKVAGGWALATGAGAASTGTAGTRKELPEMDRRRRRAGDDGVVRRLEDRIKEVDDFMQGTVSFPPERVCLLIAFCHLLELDRQAVELYQRLPRDEADPAWLSRIDRLVRVSRQRVAQQ